LVFIKKSVRYNPTDILNNFHAGIGSARLTTLDLKEAISIILQFKIIAVY